MSGDESVLLKKAAARDTDAFRVLFEAHREAVFRVAYRLTSARDVAEDITQDCFLRLVSRPDAFDPMRGSLRQFLYGMVRNLVRQHFEAHNREVPLDGDGEDEVIAGIVLPADNVATYEIDAVVQAAIASLPLLQREAIVLFEFEELPLKEVAAVVGTDVGTVKSRLHRARERLRRILRPCWMAHMPAGKENAG